MKNKIAFITGITGQDGAYLAELLISKGYIVHGLRRRVSSFNTDRIEHLLKDTHNKNIKLFLHYGDMTDSSNLIRLIKEIQPDEIYNLAAMSHVHVSFQNPEYVANVNGTGVLRLLEAVRLLKLENKTKIYQASTSELYGKVQETPQKETTPFYPRSPYGVAKLYAYWIMINYREAYNIFASNGILFNHESPIRGEIFVTRKITRALSNIVLGKQDSLFIGNLSAQRDWGHAKDYVKAMYLMLQQDTPGDYVVSTGVSTTVRDFIILAAGAIGLKVKFRGEGLSEIGIIDEINITLFKEIIGHLPPKALFGKEIIFVDPKYFRPTEVDLLVGDSTKARQELGWEPEYNVKDLAREMMHSDIVLMNKKYSKKIKQLVTNS